jgi:hypothetical protein
MVPMVIRIDISCEMNWLVYQALGTCLGVLGAIFNITRFPSERFDERRINSAMRDFSDFIF